MRDISTCLHLDKTAHDGTGLQAREPAQLGVAKGGCLLRIDCQDGALFEAALQQRHRVAPDPLERVALHGPRRQLWVDAGLLQNAGTCQLGPSAVQ